MIRNNIFMIPNKIDSVVSMKVVDDEEEEEEEEEDEKRKKRDSAHRAVLLLARINFFPLKIGGGDAAAPSFSWTSCRSECDISSYRV